MFLTGSDLAIAGIPGVCAWALCGLEDLCAAAEEHLTGSELSEYDRLKSDGRRREWLAARMALKRLLIEEKIVNSPMQCSIDKDPRGKPSVLIANGKRSHRLPCSISHKGNLAAVCFGRSSGIELGIDLEEVSLRPWKIRKSFASEGDSLEGVGAITRYYSALWACKEAVSKALGAGLKRDFKEIVVRGTRENLFVDVGKLHYLKCFFIFINGYVLAVSFMNLSRRLRQDPENPISTIELGRKVAK